MAKPKIVLVKESLQYLKKLLKSVPVHHSHRIRMLIELKKSNKGISKRKLAEVLGVNHNSIQTWREKYIRGGLSSLLDDKRKGFKPSVIKEDAHKKLEELLSNANNGIQGYKELQAWIKINFNQDIKYTTLVEYCKRHWNTKIKVARKSHIKKDKEKEEFFKKTLVVSSNQQ